MNLKIQIWRGLTRKHIFLTNMLRFELDLLNWAKHSELIQPWRKVWVVAMLLKESDTEEQKILKTGPITKTYEIEWRIKWKPLRSPSIITTVLFNPKETLEEPGNYYYFHVRTNQRVNEVIVNDISICNSNDISNAFNEQFSNIYRAQTNPRKAFKFGRAVYLFKKYFWKITTNLLFSSNY